VAVRTGKARSAGFSQSVDHLSVSNLYEWFAADADFGVAGNGLRQERPLFAGA
jgi:hypothetical protein